MSANEGMAKYAEGNRDSEISNTQSIVLQLRISWFSQVLESYFLNKDTAPKWTEHSRFG